MIEFGSVAHMGECVLEGLAMPLYTAQICFERFVSDSDRFVESFQYLGHMITATFADDLDIGLQRESRNTYVHQN